MHQTDSTSERPDSVSSSNAVVAKWVGHILRRIQEPMTPASTGTWAAAAFTLTFGIAGGIALEFNWTQIGKNGAGVLGWPLLLALATLVVFLLAFTICWTAARIHARLGQPVSWVLIVTIFTIFVVNQIERTSRLTVISDSFKGGGVWILALIIAFTAGVGTRLVRSAPSILVISFLASLAPFASTLPDLLFGMRAEYEVIWSDDAVNGPILWVVADELPAYQVTDERGVVRSELPNLQRLQNVSVTYSRAYSPSPTTALVFPAVLGGVTDLTATPLSVFEDLRHSVGAGRVVDDRYEFRLLSDYLSTEPCALSCFARDTGVLFHRFLLGPTLQRIIPSIESTWERGLRSERFRDNRSAAIREVGLINSPSRSGRLPFLVVHDLGTHSPWMSDSDERSIYESGDLAKYGLNELTRRQDRSLPDATFGSLERTLGLFAVMDFDRFIGRLLDELEESGNLERTTIVVMSDHGFALSTDVIGRRPAPEPVVARDQVANVPLIVKPPYRINPSIIHYPVSTSQVMQSVISLNGGDFRTNYERSGDLADGLPPTISFVSNWRLDRSVVLNLDEHWMADTPPVLVDQSGRPSLTPRLELADADQFAGTHQQPVQLMDFEVLPGESNTGLATFLFEASACPIGTLPLLVDDRAFPTIVVFDPKADQPVSTGVRGWSFVARTRVERPSLICSNLTTSRHQIGSFANIGSKGR